MSAIDVNWESFSDEMEKIAWLGTYYHGSSPSAENSILQEGLKASLGGSGTAKNFSNVAELSGSPLLGVMANRFKKETAGKVSMSRSKNVARVYGLAADKGRLKQMFQSVKQGIRERSPLQGLRSAARTALDYQPLEVAGKGLTGLTRDPSHLLLGVQRATDVPANLISRAQPSRLGNLLRRLL